MLTLEGVLDYLLTKALRRFSPDHVAIILDGNRRYAKLRGITQMEGHIEGAFVMKKIIPKLIELNVKYVSMFVFSVENFSRKESSVEETLSVIRNYLVKEKDWLNEVDSKVLVSGKLEMLPIDLRNLLIELENDTKNNKGIVFNVCCAYSYTTELEYSMNKYLCDYKSKKHAVKSDLNSKNSHDQTESMLEDKINNEENECVISDEIYKNYLYNPEVPFPEILIRTSGETRLSDYLIYQVCHNTRIYFVKVLWPQINNLTVLFVILHYVLFYS
ncbi:hypothetical protein FG379_002393 [Cryptosporidium bovis]|uniref:uncharacterized protein n=1 Tax=Cryptosporidium bovis TaxID=310047 RepID=UPI00351A40DA|nr:hypothetical protein FG379_002393 [Cryptosporidium bovis]